MGKNGFKGRMEMWGCSMVQHNATDCNPDFILAASDVEGNFLVVKAYQSTNLLSAMLLDT
jgi:hypothetical protein